MSFSKRENNTPAVTSEVPILLGANNMPCFDIAQNYGHLEEKIGIKPRFETIPVKDFFVD